MKILIIFTVFTIHAFALSPTQDQTGGLSAFLHYASSRSITSLATLYNVFGGMVEQSRDESTSPLRVHAIRYVFSPRWGWIDMKHFAAAAQNSSTNTLGSFSALIEGTLNETKQLLSSDLSEQKSAFSYEDKMSNGLGAFFSSKYLQQDKNKKISFNSALKNYLTELGVVETPSKSAPNFAAVPETEAKVATSTVLKNYSYSPSFTTQPQNKPIDGEINRFLGKQVK